MAGRTFIFDLDDTLVLTGFKYRASIGLAYAAVVNAIREKPPDLCQFVRILRDVQKEVTGEIGYVKEQWPRTLVKTGIYFCDEQEVEAEKSLEDRLYEIGMGVYKGKVIEYPRARKTLEFLKEKKDELVLVSKGEESFQLPKLKETGHIKYFDERNIHIGPWDKKPVYEDVVIHRNPQKTFGVGDSVKDDSNPLVDLGARVLLIKPGPYDEFDGPIELARRPHIRLIEGPVDIIKYYDMLEDPEFWLSPK